MENENYVNTLRGQIIASIFVAFGAMISIATFYGFIEKAEKTCPGRDYTYLDTLTKINILILTGVSVYFFYVSYKEQKQSPQSQDIFLIEIANFVVLAAVIIKLFIVYNTKKPINVESDFDL